MRHWEVVSALHSVQPLQVRRAVRGRTLPWCRRELAARAVPREGLWDSVRKWRWDVGADPAGRTDFTGGLSAPMSLLLAVSPLPVIPQVGGGPLLLSKEYGEGAKCSGAPWCVWTSSGWALWHCGEQCGRTAGTDLQGVVRSESWEGEGWMVSGEAPGVCCNP